MQLPSTVKHLAQSQHGVVSRRQLLESGVTPAEIRWALGRSWRALLPGVILLDPGLPTLEQRQVAALLYAGPRAWLAGPTALGVHGVATSFETARVHVLVPTPLRSRDVSWASVRRTAFTNERVLERGPLRYSCLPRALVDSAHAAPDEDTARALMIEAVQRRLVRLDDVAHWVEARRSNGRLRLRRALGEAAAGAWSVPEADLARLLAASKVLPEAWSLASRPPRSSVILPPSCTGSRPHMSPRSDLATEPLWSRPDAQRSLA